VARLDQGAQAPGRHVVEWDGRDLAGRRLGSGVYFYTREGTQSTLWKKMVLLR